MLWLNRLLDVPSTDPDDARRRKLLNILLFGTTVMVLFLLLAVTTSLVADLEWEGKSPQTVLDVYLACFGLLLGVGVIYAINRFGPGWIAGSLFLVLLIVAMVLGEEREELVAGRSLLMFALPIVMASVLLSPQASFIIAGLSSLVITAIALSLQWVPNPFAMASFFSLALVSWLASRSLERALKDLRTLNLELDQRVQDRTRELAEALSRTEAILDSTADGIIVFNNNRNAIVANPATAGLLGYRPDEIMGHGIDVLMSDKVDPDDKEALIDLLDDRETTHSGIKFAWGKKTLSASLAPVRDDHDRVTGTVAVFRDFTREAEIDRMKSTFVSIASHELRTPLNAIMGYTEMLQEGVYDEPTDRQRGAMDRLMANIGHMLGLVNNLLDRARIEAGTLELNVTAFAPAELVTGMRGVMEVMAQSKGLKLTAHIADDVPAKLFGDWQRLHQILINLTNNAVKFTEKGEVSIHVYMPDTDHWALAVSDTGVGIPEDARSYIFDPFRQVDDSATREYGGAGLGLSIVRQLVDLMGGEIKLESRVGQGSTFTIVLPLILSMSQGAEANQVAEPV